MKTLVSIILAGSLFMGSSVPPRTNTIGEGEQPQLGIDTKGTIRVVFGRKDSIFCTSSTNNGISFSNPSLVARVPGMHLGMSRGPQIACSAHYSIITAMDKTGDLHCFSLNNTSKEWKNIGTINDKKGSAPEGLMSITADKNDNFYAVWLDTRTGGRNQVYFSTLAGNEGHWSGNTLIYQSPDGHVCECCKPGIHAQDKEVAVMFRNWLDSSRDLYVLRSQDQGKTFGKAQKLGEGTWKLNGCPMDGGGVTIDLSGGIHTVWQRKGFVFYCNPGERELNIGKGRTCSIAGNTPNPLLSMQTGDTLKLVTPYPQKEMTIGYGSFLQSIQSTGNQTLCVWQQDKLIKFKIV